MRFLTIALALLSLLLLAAHSLRWGDTGMTALWVAMGGLLFYRRAWCRYVLLAALLYGASQWWGATTMLVQMRLATGEPWLRMTLIMGGVLLVTFVSGVLLLAPPASRHFAKGRDTAALQSVVFLLTFATLAVARAKAPLPLLLTDRFFPGWGLFQAGAHSLYAALLAGAMLQPEMHKRLRPLIWGGFSLVFFGQLALGLAGAERLLMTGNLHLPVPALVLGGPLYRGGGFFMLILFGVTILLVGPAWCSHLCYIGAWDDGCSRLAKGAGGVPQPERTPWRGRALTLALTVLLALGLRWAGVSAMMAVLLAAAFGLGGVAVMVAVSRRTGRMVHCTTYCPLGLAANLLGRLTPWRMRISEDCTRCGKCSRVCRYGALRGEDVEKGRPSISCSLCGDCAAACRHGHLGYSFAGLPPNTARALFVGAVASLHAVFLAVARI